MASTVEEDIFVGLVEYFKTWALPATWTLTANVAFPGVTFTPGATKPFVSLEVHYNRSIETDLSLEMDPIRQGFMRANVMWPKGQGHVQGLGVAASIRKHFRRGTTALNDGTQTRIDQDPEIGVIVTGDTHVTIPVTIRWICYPKVPA
ncbi:MULTISPECIES: phage tail terminator-like protein [Rhizobium/Agrobacterium group]|uniref:phage tail terminator-like protein n=1 Tax=Rhizobium oryzihabitans TaxID=2267833 RepID=UPI00403352D1